MDRNSVGAAQLFLFDGESVRRSKIDLVCERRHRYIFAFLCSAKRATQIINFLPLLWPQSLHFRGSWKIDSRKQVEIRLLRNKHLYTGASRHGTIMMIWCPTLSASLLFLANVTGRRQLCSKPVCASPHRPSYATQVPPEGSQRSALLPGGDRTLTPWLAQALPGARRGEAQRVRGSNHSQTAARATISQGHPHGFQSRPEDDPNVPTHVQIQPFHTKPEPKTAGNAT